MDFDYIGINGDTIFTTCFQQYFRSTSGLNRPESDCEKLVNQIEEVFLFLVENAESRGFAIDKILEIPNSIGETCFSYASDISERITSYLLGRNIKINQIDSKLMTPQFRFETLSIRMMKKGLNPFIIENNGNNQVERYPSSFEKNEETKKLLSKFSRSIHYSIEDIKCSDKCLNDCSSEFQRFYYKEGKLVEMTDENKIGEGGFGMVYKIEFHGRAMAAKVVWIGELEERIETADVELDLLINIYEYTIQRAVSGSGVLLPTAVLRQQDQELNEIEEWIAYNYNIFIYPKYDCNLYELHDIQYHHLSDKILKNIMQQCLTREILIC